MLEETYEKFKDNILPADKVIHDDDDGFMSTDFIDCNSTDIEKALTYNYHDYPIEDQMFINTSQESAQHMKTGTLTEIQDNYNDSILQVSNTDQYVSRII